MCEKEREKEKETEEAAEETAMGVRRGNEGQEFENMEMRESRRCREKEDAGLNRPREREELGTW